MNKFITTFADFEVDNNSGEAIGYESAVEIVEPEYPISEDDASHFEDACDEIDYDALREAEADEAWHNLRDELHPEREAITTAIADCEAIYCNKISSHHNNPMIVDSTCKRITLSGTNILLDDDEIPF